MVGDGRNKEDLARAFEGQDAVISIVSIETLGHTTVMSEVMAAELTAMRDAGVKRLVAVSVSAIEGSRPWGLIQLVRFLLRKPYADFARMERLVRESGVEWTIVRPPRLMDEKATGRVRAVAGVKELRRGPYTISRADLAAFLLNEVVGERNVGSVVLVSRARGAS